LRFFFPLICVRFHDQVMHNNPASTFKKPGSFFSMLGRWTAFVFPRSIRSIAAVETWSSREVSEFDKFLCRPPVALCELYWATHPEGQLLPSLDPASAYYRRELFCLRSCHRLPPGQHDAAPPNTNRVFLPAMLFFLVPSPVASE